MERLMLLDGNGLIYRGYFALIEQPLTTSKGELVNGRVRVHQHRAARHPGRRARLRRGRLRPARRRRSATSGTPSTRRPGQRMPDDMRDQFPKVREVVEALGIPVYELRGFEADDVIGTLTGQAEAARPRDDDRDRRPGHAPARHRAHAADDVSLRAGSRTRSSTTWRGSTSAAACARTR